MFHPSHPWGPLPSVSCTYVPCELSEEPNQRTRTTSKQAVQRRALHGKTEHTLNCAQSKQGWGHLGFLSLPPLTLWAGTEAGRLEVSEGC